MPNSLPNVTDAACRHTVDGLKAGGRAPSGSRETGHRCRKPKGLQVGCARMAVSVSASERACTRMCIRSGLGGCTPACPPDVVPFPRGRPRTTSARAPLAWSTPRCPQARPSIPCCNHTVCPSGLRLIHSAKNNRGKAGKSESRQKPQLRNEREKAQKQIRFPICGGGGEEKEHKAKESGNLTMCGFF